jgi:thiamine-monophosphate kinase
VTTTEFELIERIRARVPEHPSVPAGIGDDAALLRPEPGRLLVASTDSLIPERHFLPDWPPSVIGHLALAVNLSDLAAMGARPRWVLMALTLPNADPLWLDAFLDGFLALADEHGVVLAGGNLARGPLNIGVHVLGDVEPDRAARRGGARPGDLIAVTGTLGDAAAAWTLGEAASATLHRRWQAPNPRVAAGQVLAGHAHAMMDLSDGLLADLGKLVRASGCGARLDLSRLPASPALLACMPETHQRQRLQAEGGSDYELLVTLDPARLDAVRAELDAAGENLSVIGEVVAGDGLEVVDESGRIMELNQDGWDHFKG